MFIEVYEDPGRSCFRVQREGDVIDVHMGCHGASPGVLSNTQGSTLVLTRIRACEGICVPWVDMGRIGAPLAERCMGQANGMGYYLCSKIVGWHIMDTMTIRSPLAQSRLGALAGDGMITTVLTTLRAFHLASQHHDPSAM